MPIDNVKQISCGGIHTIIQKNDGTVWTTGHNSNGELGLGHKNNLFSFIKMPIDNVKQVSCGSGYTMALKNDGTLWATGNNSSGQLGLGNNISVTVFTKVPVENIKQVSCRDTYTLILTDKGILSGTGNNSNGQLGMGAVSGVNEFKVININPATGIKYICDCCANNSHSAFISNDDMLFVTGKNANGQLGLGNTTDVKVFTKIKDDVREAVLGSRNTVIIRNNGEVFGLGDNSYKQIHISVINCSSPVYMEMKLKYAMEKYDNNFKVESKFDSTFVITNSGELWVAGKNSQGQLGLGNNININTFTKIPNIDNVKDVISGPMFTALLTKSGEVYAAGSPKGNIGVGSNTIVNRFTIMNTNGEIVKKLSMGSYHTAFVTEAGYLYTSGVNTYGQLGLGNRLDTTIFTKVNIDNVKDVVCGENYTFIIKYDGTVWATGKNDLGQLGLGNNTTTDVFTKVNIDNVKNIYCTHVSTFILKYDGTVWATGKNDLGQLGLGNNININTFTKIPIDNVKQVACAADHTMVLKNDDTLWGTGRNNVCQLGMPNTTLEYNTFTKADTNIGKIIYVNVGNSYTQVVTSNGFLYSVGDNGEGQLGLGNTTNVNVFTRPTIDLDFPKFEKINSCIVNNNFCLINNTYVIPVRDTKHYNSSPEIYEFDYSKILGIGQPKYRDVIKIVDNMKSFWMSKTHALYIAQDGFLYGRGSNLYGQLLNPITTPELTSFTKLNFNDVKDVACGTGFSYFVKNDGTLYSVGLNASYQLGLGHNNEVTEPQRVPGISNVKKVMCDHNFTLVLLNDNTLWAQGHNRNGNFGLGAAKVNQTIINFTKIAMDVDDVEIGTDYILLRKTDNTAYISGKIRDHYNITGNDVTVFNKIGVPDFVKPEDLTWIDPDDDTTRLIYKTHTLNSSIEVIEKSISGVKIKVDDIGNPITKIEMLINSELITTMTEFTSKVAVFSIPLDKIRLGTNNVVFKGYDNYNNNMYTSVIINKENNALCVAENSNLLINGKRYIVKSITDNENKVTVTLDRELEGNINAGDIIYQLINNLKVQIKTNNTGMHKDAKLLEIKKVDTGYQEIYEFKEDGIKEVEPKIIVNGNENTAIKRPSIIFSIDESTL
ncbi:beta-lactamase-inhibitor protein II [Clostridioides difficile]|nr:beta-lactamase-inhibitor protein II [Clostridioides difficile]